MKKLALFWLVTIAAIPLVCAEDNAVIPEGVFQRGRQVFEAKECFRCHTVQGAKFPDRGELSVELIDIGPAAHGAWTRDQFGAAIMNPQHMVSPQFQKAMIIVGDKLAAENSPMPNFNDVLTVQDLIHLVSFLAESSASGADQ